MLKIDSRRSIKKLADKGLKANKKRNLILILAIALTTFLLSGIFGIGISYITSAKDRDLRISGMDYDGMLTGPTTAQLEKARHLPGIRYAGYLSGCGGMVEYRHLPANVSFRWVDRTCWTRILKPAKEYVVGHYPRRKMEILLSKKVLDKLKIRHPKVGMKLTCTYNNTLAEKTGTFTLSGYYKDYTGKQLGFVSTPFYKDANMPDGDADTSRLYLQIKDPLVGHDDSLRMEKQLGVTMGHVLSVDTELSETLPVMLAGGGVLILLIMLAGYLVIVNVLYISVSRDIRYYGLLKTVGVTPRQIRRILLRQMCMLLLIAIPAGLICGAFLSIGVTPQLVTIITGTKANASFHPLIFAGAALFAIITTAIGMRRPLRLARRISPIEAARYTGTVSRKAGRDAGGVKLTRMAARNIFREKKKAIVVFASLIIGMSAFVCFITVLKTNDARNFLNTWSYDLIVENNTVGYPDRLKDPKPAEQRITPEVIRALKAVPGVKGVAVTTTNKAIIGLQPSVEPIFTGMFRHDMMRLSLAEGRKDINIHPEEYASYLTGIDEEGFDDLQKNLLEPVDKKAFMAGKAMVFSSFPMLDKEYKSSLHKSITYTLDEEAGRPPHTLKVTALTDDSPGQREGFWGNLIVSENLVHRLLPEPMTDSVSVDYKKPFDKDTEAAVKAIVRKDKLLTYDSKLERYKDMHASEGQLKVFGGALMLILTLLGIMNYVNMMITSLENRHTETAILRSLGMTGRQTRKMLALEGFGYGLISCMAAAALGIGLGYCFYQFMPMYEGLTFLLPVPAVLGFFAVMLAFSTALPVWIYKRTNTKSIVEELRSME